MNTNKPKCTYCSKDIRFTQATFFEDPYLFCNTKCRNRYRIMEAFNKRCALNPSHYATTIHEIVPRSLRPDSWWDMDNMIPLCAKCHDKVHNKGSKNYKDELRKLLEDAL